uniref:Uncharacterized protein n=1 Tax=Clandestinovirus TaxID=2831644 RepID=A0A8F8KPG4_9VIRU|nr:hypothetical protein KOM_12_393 [Clandestinovirus]
MQIPRELHRTILSKLPTFMLVRLQGTLISHERFIEMLSSRIHRPISVKNNISNVLRQYVYHIMFQVDPDDAHHMLGYARIFGGGFRQKLEACIKGEEDYSVIQYRTMGIKHALKKFRQKDYFRWIMFDFGIVTSKSADFLPTMFSEDFLAVVASLLEKQVPAKLKLYLDDKCCDGYTFYLHDTKGKHEYSFDIDRDTNKVIKQDVSTFTKLIQYVRQ